MRYILHTIDLKTYTMNNIATTKTLSKILHGCDKEILLHIKNSIAHSPIGDSLAFFHCSIKSKQDHYSSF